jgi:hypothetical protein
MANHKYERSEMEKKYQSGEQRLNRNFSSLKELFNVFYICVFLNIFNYFLNHQ